MTLEEIEIRAKHLINLHCPDYTFIWMNRKTTLGYCDYNKKQIALSKFHALKNPISVTRNTVLHECSHAIVGPGFGHGKEWKKACVRIGAEPKRCATVERTEHKWELNCSCGLYKYYRKPRISFSARCRKCKSGFKLKEVK